MERGTDSKTKSDEGELPLKKPVKISDTSIRVLETLKILAQNPSSIQNIINYFEKTDPNNRIYTNEVILKYINTLKVFGFRFVKEKDKYVILNYPSQFEFSETELNSMYLIEKSVEFLPEEKIKSDIAKFLQSLEKRFSDNTRLLAHSIKKPLFNNLEFNYAKYEAQIKQFEGYCAEGQKLKVNYQNPSEEVISVIVEPNEIKYRGRDVYLNVYNSLAAKIQDINLDYVLEISQLPIRSNPTKMLSTATFRLKDRLACAYRLHDGERILQKEANGDLVVLNQNEDKSMLLKRLMRYGENCEVIAPKNLREEMVQMIESTLSVYQ